MNQNRSIGYYFYAEFRKSLSNSVYDFSYINSRPSYELYDMSWDYENYEIDSNNEHIQITHNHKLIFHSIDVEDEIHFMFADIENYLL